MLFGGILSCWLRIGRVSKLALILVVVAAASGASTANAAEPIDPVRLVPPSANLIVKIDRPRAIADLAANLVSRPELAGFRGYRDYFESTNYQLFKQLVGHFERELGNRWADLLDELAGDGIVLALKIEKERPGAGARRHPRPRPEAVGYVFPEGARCGAARSRRGRGSTTVTRSDKYRDIETLHRGDKIHSALLGSAPFIAIRPLGCTKRSISISIRRKRAC